MKLEAIYVIVTIGVQCSNSDIRAVRVVDVIAQTPKDFDEF